MIDAASYFFFLGAMKSSKAGAPSSPRSMTPFGLNSKAGAEKGFMPPPPPPNGLPPAAAANGFSGAPLVFACAAGWDSNWGA